MAGSQTLPALCFPCLPAFSQQRDFFHNKASYFLSVGAESQRPLSDHDIRPVPYNDANTFTVEFYRVKD